MRHSHHTRRHHDTDGMYSPNGFSLHALWHAIGRERYREGRDGRGGRGDGRGYDRADDRAHGRAERGFEDFAGAGRGSPYPDRFSLHALWHAIGHHHRGGERVELMLAKLTHIARKMDSVRRAFAGEEQLDPAEGGWLPELIEARRALKHALLRRDNVPAAEQRRIAAILARATAEIEGNPGAATGADTGAGDI
jgi:hypothetical protein